jgi:hypothetical protein
MLSTLTTESYALPCLCVFDETIGRLVSSGVELSPSWARPVGAEPSDRLGGQGRRFWTEWAFASASMR